MEASAFDLVAASLRADMRDAHAFVEALAEKLSLALPGLVKVERPRSLGKRLKPVRRITVDLPGERFALDATGGSLAVARSTVVRGIALRTEALPLDVWIDELARAIASEAEQTQEGRAALERLVL